jgi:hypothetical protein
MGRTSTMKLIPGDLVPLLDKRSWLGSTSAKAIMCK